MRVGYIRDVTSSGQTYIMEQKHVPYHTLPTIRGEIKEKDSEEPCTLGSFLVSNLTN